MIMFFVLCTIIMFSSYLYYLVYNVRNNQRDSPFTENILRSPGHSVIHQLELKTINLLELYVVYIGGSFLALLCFSSVDTLVFRSLSLLMVFGLTVFIKKASHFI